MIDERTENILKLIRFHAKAQNTIVFLCYATIALGVIVYVFYSLFYSENKKLVSKLRDKLSMQVSEKVLMNPTITYQHGDNKIYHIQANKAVHKDDTAITMYDVKMQSQAGEVQSGKLEIKESGDYLLFTDKPVLLINEIKENTNEQ